MSLERMDLWKHFQDGGWGMYPIALWLVFTVLIALERTAVLWAFRGETQALHLRLRRCILSGDLDEAIRIAREARTPAGRVVAEGLARAAQPDDQVQLAVDASMLRETPRLWGRTPYLPALGNLALASGIVGTLSGMIPSFGSVGGESVDPSQKARILAEGIGEALNCTAFGLIVAIAAYITFIALQSAARRTERATAEVTVSIVNLVLRHRDMVFDPHAATPAEGCEERGEIRSGHHGTHAYVDITVLWGDDVLEIVRWTPSRRRPTLDIAEVCGAPFASLRLERDERGDIRWTFRSAPWPKPRKLRVDVAWALEDLPTSLRPGLPLAARARTFDFGRRKRRIGALAALGATVSVVAHAVPMLTAAYTYPELGQTWWYGEWDSYDHWQPKKEIDESPYVLPIRIVQTPVSPDPVSTICPWYELECGPTRFGQGELDGMGPRKPGPLPREEAERRGPEWVIGYAFDNWIEKPEADLGTTGLPRVHVVRAGETLIGIAARYALPRWRCIYDRKLNPELVESRPSPNRIWPGDRVRVPAKCTGREIYGFRR